MLSPNSPAQAAMPVCAQYLVGASMVQAVAAVTHERAVMPVFSAAAAQAVAGPRPRPREDAVLFGNATQAAGETIFVPQQRTSQKFAHKTLIAAAGGGASGPHPARDPV
jgi:hypothetical protein